MVLTCPNCGHWSDPLSILSEDCLTAKCDECEHTAEVEPHITEACKEWHRADDKMEELNPGNGHYRQWKKDGFRPTISAEVANAVISQE